MNLVQRLVYGELTDDQLVFIPESEAIELAQLQTAIQSSRTWGEFKAQIPPPRWLQAISNYVDNDEPLPADDHPFDTNELPGYGDGDWPQWPAQRMLEWMPEVIRTRFGDVGTSMVSGDMLSIDPASESGIIAALKDAGYTCIRDDHLVSTASGYGY